MSTYIGVVDQELSSVEPFPTLRSGYGLRGVGRPGRGCVNEGGSGAGKPKQGIPRQWSRQNHLAGIDAGPRQEFRHGLVINEAVELKLVDAEVECRLY